MAPAAAATPDFFAGESANYSMSPAQGILFIS
jgi:hypothetical protein